MNRYKKPNRKRTAGKKGFRLTQSIHYNDSVLQSMFTAADALLPIDETRRADTRRLLQQEFRSRTVLPLQDNRLLPVSLLRYTDRHLPCLHLLGCIAMLLVLLTMGLYFPTPQDAGVMVFASMTLPCFLVFFSVFEFRQICFTGMGELSKTCFFQIRQLAALSMIFSGILNLMAVSAATPGFAPRSCFRWPSLAWLLSSGLPCIRNPHFSSGPPPCLPASSSLPGR